MEIENGIPLDGTFLTWIKKAYAADDPTRATRIAAAYRKFVSILEPAEPCGVLDLVRNRRKLEDRIVRAKLATRSTATSYGDRLARAAAAWPGREAAPPIRRHKSDVIPRAHDHVVEVTRPRRTGVVSAPSGRAVRAFDPQNVDEEVADLLASSSRWPSLRHAIVELCASVLRREVEQDLAAGVGT